LQNKTQNVLAAVGCPWSKPFQTCLHVRQNTKRLPNIFFSFFLVSHVITALSFVPTKRNERKAKNDAASVLAFWPLRRLRQPRSLRTYLRTFLRRVRQLRQKSTQWLHVLGIVFSFNHVIDIAANQTAFYL